jgi:hypothetical protein
LEIELVVLKPTRLTQFDKSNCQRKRNQWNRSKSDDRKVNEKIETQKNRKLRRSRWDWTDHSKTNRKP